MADDIDTRVRKILCVSYGWTPHRYTETPFEDDPVEKGDIEHHQYYHRAGIKKLVLPRRSRKSRRR